MLRLDPSLARGSSVPACCRVFLARIRACRLSLLTDWAAPGPRCPVLPCWALLSCMYPLALGVRLSYSTCMACPFARAYFANTLHVWAYTTTHPPTCMLLLFLGAYTCPAASYLHISCPACVEMHLARIHRHLSPSQAPCSAITTHTPFVLGGCLHLLGLYLGKPMQALFTRMFSVLSRLSSVMTLGATGVRIYLHPSHTVGARGHHLHSSLQLCDLGPVARLVASDGSCTIHHHQWLHIAQVSSYGPCSWAWAPTPLPALS